MNDEHPGTHEHDEHEKRPGGSGSSGPDSTEKEQAGSYGRDAEQDPDEAPESTAEQRER